VILLAKPSQKPHDTIKRGINPYSYWVIEKAGLEDLDLPLFDSFEILPDNKVRVHYTYKSKSRSHLNREIAKFKRFKNFSGEIRGRSLDAKVKHGEEDIVQQMKDSATRNEIKDKISKRFRGD
jgi:hypothetical protein